MLTLRTAEGRVICPRVRVASSFGKRLRGLMGRPSLATDEGLYLPGSNGIHMLFMRFPIDCIFLTARSADGTQRVVATRSSLRPWLGVVWYVRGASGVIELPAGTIAASGVRKGDVLRFEEPAD